MKYCTHCGKEINENLKFCTGCGAPCNGTQETSAQASNPPASNTTININLSSLSKILPNTGNDVLSANPFLNLLKKTGSGVTYFVFLVILGVSLLTGFIGALTADIPGMGLIDSLGSPFGFSSSDLMDFVPFLDSINNGFKALKLLGLIPAALTFAGVLIFYMRSKSNSDLKRPTDGFTLIKIPVILYLAGNALAVAGCFLGGILFAIGNSEGIAVLIGILLSLAFVVLAAYYVMILAVLKGVEKSIAAGRYMVSNALLTALTVFNFIAAFKELCFGGNGFFGNLVSAAAIVTITICIITFKKNVALLSVQDTQNEYSDIPENPMV